MAQTNDNEVALLEEALTCFVDECLQGNRPDVDEFVEQYPRCAVQLKARLQDLRQIDSLFDSLVRADEAEFNVTATGDYLTGRTIGHFEIREEVEESRKILQSFWRTYDCHADSTAFDLRVYVDLTLLLGELW